MDRELYQEIILSHFRNPKWKELLADIPDVHVVKNPNCGDVVKLKAMLDDAGSLKLIHDAQGCAASVASCSILCDRLNGLKPDDAAARVGRFLKALQSDAGSEPSWNDDVEIEALLFFRNVPARRLCVSLAWSCAQNALAAIIKAR